MWLIRITDFLFDAPVSLIAESFHRKMAFVSDELDDLYKGGILEQCYENMQIMPIQTPYPVDREMDSGTSDSSE